MDRLRRLLDHESDIAAHRDVVEELPIRVAEDWDTIVSRAEKMAEVIDRHLDFESKLQGRELRPVTLCPEQRVCLISDLTAV
ncbi:MAG TPA: hypothetical protein PLZ21_06535 [Armatimonadota bacterium]|nr:hypothetical protein [Armatimonadota bacterium]